MDGWRDQLFYGDNLDILRRHLDDNFIDLVYLDPPFNSSRSYNVLFRHRSGEESQAQIEAFDDTWTWSQESEGQYQELINGGAPPRVADAIEAMRRLLGENDLLAYLVMMTARLIELHRVLKSTGSLYLHCDPTASHYLKILLDAVFGPKNFRNEIVWKRTAVKGDARLRYGRNHDTILFYSKTTNQSFQPQTTPHSEEYSARFRFNDRDGRGPYRDGPLDSPNPRPNLTYSYKGYPPPKNGWRVNLTEMESLDAENRLIFPKKPEARIMRKLYLSERVGVPMGDMWTDIAPINSQAAERLGYPTQKPLTLLERIITASSKRGDIILDPFCGCGTAIDAAQKLGRRWIGIDITYLAVDLIEKRLRGVYGESILDSFTVVGIPRDVEAARALWNRSPFEFERWAVSQIDAQPNERQVHDRGFDGVIRFPADGKGSTDRILVSVKGGRRLGPHMIRDLLGAVNNQRAVGGVLITLEPPTPGMLDAVNHSGMFRAERQGRSYPKVQIISVPDLLRGIRPKLPPVLLPYIQAQRKIAESDQLTLDE
jgi:DNA modification methylase